MSSTFSWTLVKNTDSNVYIKRILENKGLEKFRQSCRNLYFVQHKFEMQLSEILVSNFVETKSAMNLQSSLQLRKVQANCLHQECGSTLNQLDKKRTVSPASFHKCAERALDKTSHQKLASRRSIVSRPFESRTSENFVGKLFYRKILSICSESTLACLAKAIGN